MSHISIEILTIFIANLLQYTVTISEDIDFVDNTAVNSSEINETCTNELCISDDEYVDLIAESLKPDIYDWIFITMHIAVFIAGIIGNALVCAAVYRNRTMRTVTNYFIVNLAIADLMVIIFCLPPTVLWDLTETWFLGDELCKIIPYLQTVSVSVSILTLTIISIDRWYAICLPLEFKSTTGRAKKAICFIWLFSFVFDLPELIVLHVVPPTHLKVQTIFYTQCLPAWSVTSDRGFTIIKLLFLYFGPLLFMTIAYRRIIRVLWKSEIPGYNLTGNNHVTPLTSNETLDGQLVVRKKAAKMLVAVVLVFGLCYAPINLVTILRQSIGLPSNDFTVACSLLAHWLCYVNSAINPVIYNFMSEKFRREFKRSFYCSRDTSEDRGMYKFAEILQPIERRSTVTKLGQTMSINPDTHRRSIEVIPLGSVESRPQSMKR